MLWCEFVLEEECGESVVFVFVDVDFIMDQFVFVQNLFGIVQVVNDNYRVFFNSVDFFFGLEELMKVCVKKGLSWFFIFFDEIEEQVEVDMLE